MQVLVIGDSIVHGGIDDEAGGWVNRLKVRSCREGRGDHVFNLGLGGNSSRDLLARAEAEIAARRGHVRNVIFSTGTNDMNLGMPVAEFAANLARLGEIAAAAGKRTYFLGLFRRTDRDAAADTAAFDRAVRDACAAGGRTYIPTADVIAAEDLPDGVHPNARGHAKLCERVAGFLVD
jgi:lysophospholipase L1-like esterase